MRILDRIMFALALTLSASSASHAQDEHGQQPEKAAMCERCHGVGGVTTHTMMPNIAGQNKGYLVKQMTSFRDGLRRSTPMREVMRQLTEQDIEELAAYYSELSPAP